MNVNEDYFPKDKYFVSPTGIRFASSFPTFYNFPKIVLYGSFSWFIYFCNIKDILRFVLYTAWFNKFPQENKISRWNRFQRIFAFLF